MSANIAAELPPRMTCLACFKPSAFEQRISKRGGVYYVCPFCSLRIFVNNSVQAYGLTFWSRALTDEALLQTARADLERALSRQTASRPTQRTEPNTPVAVAEPAQPNPIEISLSSLGVLQ